MNNLTRRGFVGALSAAAAMAQKSRVPIKITDLRCAIMGGSPVVRILTDQGISGYGQAETRKPYLKPMVLFYKDYIVGEDPTDVQNVLLKIRRMGGFKPWGSAVSAIEIALWDIAGQVSGLPVYKLLGGKIRERVRIYNGGVRPAMTGQTPQDYAENTAKMKESKEGFTLIKQAVGFHNPAMMRSMENGWYDQPRTGAPHADAGLMTERGMDYVLERVVAMKKVLGKDIGLALDCGPGWMVKDAIRFARALEPLNITWLEDLITGDYTQYPNAEVFREVTQSTSVPIHTGEQIYLRENFKDLIEKQAVNVVGPDPEDVGGISELKWIAEYAELHGILMAPHGIFDGLIGLAAHVQMAAALPRNFIAFEYPVAQDDWWYQIIDGLPDPIAKKGFIDVWDKPGLGVKFNVNAAKAHLAAEDRAFFD